MQLNDDSYDHLFWLTKYTSSITSRIDKKYVTFYSHSED